MGKKQIKCILCGGNVIYDNITDKFMCSECNAHHSTDMFNSQKKKRYLKYYIFFSSDIFYNFKVNDTY